MRLLLNWTFVILTFMLSVGVQGQDLLSLLEDENEFEIVTASFKTTRIINLHSLENTAPGVLDVKISHRFGFINSGAHELFGLDNASIRIGLDYGITDHLMVGLGRSSFEKSFDGFVKVKLLRQRLGTRPMPISLTFLSAMAIKTVDFSDPTRDYDFNTRLSYVHQFLIGSKITEGLSLLLTPTMVHRNLVSTNAEENDVFAMGMGGRVKLTSRLTLNAEYIYVFKDQLDPQFRNSFSVGFDIETGGHVFQLHFTNSTSMIEKGFITETVGAWSDGDIHFGFNISRVFTIASNNR